MKIFEGIVKKISGNTGILEIQRLVAHPIYKKVVRKSSHIKFHISGNEVKIGDKIKIVETRPISKDKNFKIFISTKKEKK